MENGRAAEKYLDLYGEEEARNVPAILVSTKGRWREVIVVPASDEYESLPKMLQSVNRALPSGKGRLLLILVINGRIDSSQDVHTANALLFADLLDWGKRVSTPPLTFVEGRVFDLLLVDRQSPAQRFESKEGVGLARKIGCDLALRLIAQGAVQTNWIRNTDADAQLPEDYFTTPEAAASCSAMLTPFDHQIPPGKMGEALRLYDISLRYYVLALHGAGSPYAFHSVGSTIAVAASAYASARGMPKRQAGEDFYLLNKLAKLAPIFPLDSQAIKLSYRPSVRVPFGTAAGSEKVLEGLESSLPFCLYHPQIFSRIGELMALARSWQCGEDAMALRQRAPHTLARLETDKAEPWSYFTSASKQKCSQQRMHYNFNCVFDGFRTLKLVHYLRDNGLPSQPWRAPLTTGLTTRSSEATAEEIQAQLISCERQRLRGIAVGPTLWR